MKNQRALPILMTLLLTSTFSFGQVRCLSCVTSSDSNSASGNINKVKKRIISFGFFSPLNHHISVGYDQVVGSQMVFSGQLGIIGPGITPTYEYTDRGLFAEAGIKLYFSPDYIMDGMRRYNAMQGAYFKPQIVVSTFTESQLNYYNYQVSHRLTTS